MKCEICNKEIKGDSQFINGAYYHNMCLEQVIVAYKIEQKVHTHTEKQILQSRIDKAIEYLYKHSQYNDGDGVHYIKEDEYCVDYLLDILKESGE